MVHFVSGHLSLSQEEFDLHYKPFLDAAISANHSFVVGDARGADTMVQEYLFGKTEKVTVFHMMNSPRYNTGFPTEGGFLSDEDRDSAMTDESDSDIAWVREGREESGTQRNLDRRIALRYRLQYLGGER